MGNRVHSSPMTPRPRQSLVAHPNPDRESTAAIQVHIRRESESDNSSGSFDLSYAIRAVVLPLRGRSGAFAHRRGPGKCRLRLLAKAIQMLQASNSVNRLIHTYVPHAWIRRDASVRPAHISTATSAKALYRHEGYPALTCTPRRTCWLLSKHVRGGRRPCTME